MKKSITLILLLISSYIPMNSQTVFTHPWQGKRVAYFGDSITDPKNSGSKKKFWGFLNEWLGITPYVYGISGRQWNDIPNQARKLKEQHGDDVDAILIFVGTNDFNHSIPLGEWFEEKEVLDWILKFIEECIAVLSKHTTTENLVKFIKDGKNIDKSVKEYLSDVFV